MRGRDRTEWPTHDGEGRSLKHTEMCAWRFGGECDCHASVIHSDPAVCDGCRETALKPVCRDGGVYCGDQAACKQRTRQRPSQPLTGRQGS